MRMFGGDPAPVEEFKKAVGYGTAIFQFDAVNRVADGTIEASATPGTTLYSGVALNWGPAATATTHLVITDPHHCYVAQDNSAAPGLLEIDMGMNANLVLTAGNVATQLSKHQVNATGIAVTATLDVHLLRKYDVPDNDYGPHCRVEIIFNSHRMNGAAVGV
jgi:hypothetical protein